MTIARRGLRTITVDGRAYVWRVPPIECPCCARAVVIADASRRGSVIHLPNPFGSDAAITPALVAARVREALERGWRPGEGAGVFTQLAGAK
jgi:hypothetical protein